MFYQLSVTTTASTESVLAPTNASVSKDTPERRAVKVGIWGPGEESLENVGHTGYWTIAFAADNLHYKLIRDMFYSMQFFIPGVEI